MAKKEEKFDFKEHIKEFDLNKYVKEGFIRSLEKEPKTFVAEIFKILLLSFCFPLITFAKPKRII